MSRFYLSLVAIFIGLFTQNLYAMSERTLHIEHATWGKSWFNHDLTSHMNIINLLQELSLSPSGKELIKQARQRASHYGYKLEDILKVGKNSLTDTTLTRKFSTTTPETIVYELRSLIYLNRDLSFKNAVLDLAHELTHFTYKEDFNPYHESFELNHFIVSTIEGKGGEVHAFIVECQIQQEIFPTSKDSQSRCSDIMDEKGHPSVSKASQLFYRVGNYYSLLENELAKRDKTELLKRLTSEKVSFISSAYNLPYPVAAMKEFDNVLARVCENDKNRVAYIKSNQGRSPSSFNQKQMNFLQNYQQRCP